jgi:hypothetical protein
LIFFVLIIVLLILKMLRFNFLKITFILALDLAIFKLSRAELFKNFVPKAPSVPFFIGLRQDQSSCHLMMIRLTQGLVFVVLHVLDADELAGRVACLSGKTFLLVLVGAVEVAHSVPVDNISIAEDGVVAKLLLELLHISIVVETRAIDLEGGMDRIGIDQLWGICDLRRLLSSVLV